MSSQVQQHEEGAEDLKHVRTVHAFDVNTFIENIAVRRSGQILVCVHNTNDLIQVDPHGKLPPRVLHHFPTNLMGIVEVEEDVFYVSSGSIGQPGTFAVYKVDLSDVSTDTSGKTTKGAVVEKLTDLPEALFLNGSALLDAAKGIILVADSLLGKVFSVNVKTGQVETWLHDKALAKATDNPVMPGVNGIKMNEGYLYLSNTDARTFLRAEVTGAGDATGGLQVLYDKCNIDDFALDAEGSAYLTSHIFNSVFKITKNGVRTRIAGGPQDVVVAGTTAVAFGRTPADQTTIYVTTNGGMSNPVNGEVGKARVLAIDVGVGSSSRRKD